jgi:thiazole synthase
MDPNEKDENILNYIPKDAILVANTSGARSAEEAVRIAKLSREFGCGNFVKIEIINDMKYLMPDNNETVKATEMLAKDGFYVLPYILPDLIICKQLEDAGAAAVMPLGSPIGSNKGLETRGLIEIIIENSNLPVIVDAGIGRPSQAAEAMEMGADAVLVNTAIATAEDPVSAAYAFSLAVKAGRIAYLSKLREEEKYAQASSPLTGFLR